MRRILDILLTAAALLALAGCGDRLHTDTGSKEDRPAGLTFSVSVPEAGGAMGTKSLSSEALTSLWVLVFDDLLYRREHRISVPREPSVFPYQAHSAPGGQL